MKIIDQKYEIFDMPKATDVLQVLQHIEKCGRICYKSEDKITDTSAYRFISSIRDRGHWSVLEHYTFSVWVPELTFMRLQSLKDGTLNDANMRNSLKFIEISRVQFPKEEGKEFLVSLSATSINNLWSNNEIFESPIENLFIFVAKDYPDLIKIPDHIDMDIKFHPDEFKYATVEDIKAVDLHKTHVFMTVKFTANRAILNEITRHRIASFSQSSTRYCNYSNDKFDNQISIIENNSIKKDSEEYFIWEKTLQICELAYKELTAAGIKPEIARDILPLALESELMMTASLFEWNHFFNMRTTHGAHPQIRDLAIPLNNEFAQLFPDVFQTKGVEV